MPPWSSTSALATVIAVSNLAIAISNICVVVCGAPYTIVWSSFSVLNGTPEQ